MNITSLKEKEEILAFVLFGSTARQDNDFSSDKDVFVLCHDMSMEDLLTIKHDIVKRFLGKDISLSVYRLSDVKIMAKKGSLFLWHLKIQGKVLFSKNKELERIFDNLTEYNTYQQDLKFYSELSDDVKISLSKWGNLDEFDLSVLFTIVRNTCILLCHHLGTPKFGRSNAFLHVKTVYKDLPLKDYTYQILCSQKLWYERGVNPSKSRLTRNESSDIIKEVNRFIGFAQKECR